MSNVLLNITMLNMKNIIAAGAKEDVGFFGLGLVFGQIVIH